MKKLFVFLCAFLFLLGIAGSLNAGTFYCDYYTPEGSPIFLKNYEKPHYHQWWMDLTGDGYDPVSEYLTRASLYLWLGGDGDKYDETGVLRVSTDNLYEAKILNPNMDQWIELDVGIDWLQDGSTRFKLEAVKGDFYFKKAKLKAYAKPVSEPATMLLLGSGLLGLVGIGRKKLFKK